VTEAELCEHWAQKSGRPVDDPGVLTDVDWAMRSERAAHAGALERLERDLRGALAGPVPGREQRVMRLLGRERERLSGRAESRIARASRRLPLQVRVLSDAELGVPLGGLS